MGKVWECVFNVEEVFDILTLHESHSNQTISVSSFFSELHFLNGVSICVRSSDKGSV